VRRKAQRHKGPEAQRHKGTKAQRPRGTEAQRHRGTKGQRGREKIKARTCLAEYAKDAEGIRCTS